MNKKTNTSKPTSKPTSKKLTATKLYDIHTKQHPTKTIQVKIKDTFYPIKIDVIFSETKMKDYIMELMTNYKSFENLLSLPDYSIFLMVKHFSDIDTQDINSVTEQLKLFSIFVDLGIVEPVLQAFDEKEMTKLKSYMSTIENNMKDFKNNPDMLNQIEELAKKQNTLNTLT